jgi:hypothetical protein
MTGTVMSSKTAALVRWLSVGSALTILLGGCDAPKNYADSSYVYRAVDSPDGGSTARLARIVGGGAAGWLFYDVYLSNNTPDAATELVFRGYGDCNSEAEWRGNQLLLIRYTGGDACDVQSFHSIWKERQLQRGREQTKQPNVEIMLERVVLVPTAESPPNTSFERTREG